MKSFDKIMLAVILLIAIIFAGANLSLLAAEKDDENKPYRVEISRLCNELGNGASPDISACRYVTGITAYDGTVGFYNVQNPYVIKEIDSKLYRFDYVLHTENVMHIRIILNCSLAVLGGLLLAIMLFIRKQLLQPFYRLANVPYELSKGNLSIPLEENRSRFFGRFMWGVNLLRETMEQQKQHELALQKEKQTLLLSISHDIKTPLSAIMLYASALSKGLYQDTKKQQEAFCGIQTKADEIEHFVSELSHAASEDFLQFEVKNSEFYLSKAVDYISAYYTEKLAVNKTKFHIDTFADCIVRGDLDRSIEVLQNIIENAIKYGDGRMISITFSEEEGCRLITIKNSGSTLPESELVHIFDSFWRGSNSGGKSGSGLGLYICRQLMFKMNGDIFAEINGEEMLVTVVFQKA
ncbi:MAG: HAMP domain-containing histidine kinase [Lachnospiraceae bacterium]|nr:HAMP domain-containing histidine kinase [Lachnospiraceae bacterium]